jgi:hypothetical protein
MLTIVAGICISIGLIQIRSIPIGGSGLITKKTVNNIGLKKPLEWCIENQRREEKKVEGVQEKGSESG